MARIIFSLLHFLFLSVKNPAQFECDPSLNGNRCWGVLSHLSPSCWCGAAGCSALLLPLADTELSENLCRWKTHELNVKSKVLTVNTMGDGASTYRTPMVSFFFCRLSVHLFDSTDAQIVVLTSPSRSSILSYAEIFLKI